MSTEVIIQGTTPIIRVTAVEEDENGALVAVDLSGAATKTLYLIPQTGAQMDKTPTFETNGVDGVVLYQGRTTDFVATGIWTKVLKATWANGDVFSSIPETFTVVAKRYTEVTP